MKRLILPVLCFAAAGAAAQEIYRWTDERGVIHYGEKPPANRPATVVNTRPAAGSVDEQGRPIVVVTTPAPAPQPAVQPQPVFVPVPVAPPAAQEPVVRGMDFATYTRLQRGMSEGELILRAGRPDQESVENTRRFVIKSMYYYPTVANPYITIVTLRGGRISDIERTRKTF